VALWEWDMTDAKGNFDSSFSKSNLENGQTERDTINFGPNNKFIEFTKLTGINDNDEGYGGRDKHGFDYQDEDPDDGRDKPKKDGDQETSTSFPKKLNFFDGGGPDVNAYMELKNPNFKVYKGTSLKKLKVRKRDGTQKDIQAKQNDTVTEDLKLAPGRRTFYDFAYEGNEGANGGKPEKNSGWDRGNKKELWMYDSCNADGCVNTFIRLIVLENTIERAPVEVIEEPEPVEPPPPEPEPDICLKTLEIELTDGSGGSYVQTGGATHATVIAGAKGGPSTSATSWTFTGPGLVDPPEVPAQSGLDNNARSLPFPTTCGQKHRYIISASYEDAACDLTATPVVISLSSEQCPAPDPKCDKSFTISTDLTLVTGDHEAIDDVQIVATATGVPTSDCNWIWNLEGGGGGNEREGIGKNLQILDFPNACETEANWTVYAEYDDTADGGHCQLTSNVVDITLRSNDCPEPEPPPPPPEPIIIDTYVGGPCPTSSDWSNGFPANYSAVCPDTPTADRTEESLGGLILKQDPINKDRLKLTFGSLEGFTNPILTTLGLTEDEFDKSLANKLITIKVEWKRNSTWAQRVRINASCSDIKEGTVIQTAGSPYSRAEVDYSTPAGASAYAKDFILYNIDGSSTVTFHHTSTAGPAPTRSFFTGETYSESLGPQDDSFDPPQIIRTITTTCQPPGGVTETFSPWPPCGTGAYVTKSGGTTATAVYNDGQVGGGIGDQEIEITLLAIRESVIEVEPDESIPMEELREKVWIEDLNSDVGVADVDTNGSSRTGTDVNYGVAGVTLDVSYFSSTTYKRPVVIGVHGGAFRGGDKDGFDNDAMKGTYFTNLGYNYVSVNYRLATNANLETAATGANVTLGSIDFTQPAWSNASRLKIDDQLSDLAKAVKWVIDNADTYNFDVNNIAFFGHSAGAHLVTALGTRSDILDAEGVDVSTIRGVVSIDTDGFDIVSTIQGAFDSGTVSTSANDWMFMNVYGVHPSIPGASGLDFANLAAANTYLASRSIRGNLQSASKPYTSFAQSICAIVRGTAAKRTENANLITAAQNKGMSSSVLIDYGAGAITDGTITYDHEGIHDVLGGADLSSENQDLQDLGLGNVSSEIAKYLRSVFSSVGGSGSSNNLGAVDGNSLADYHEHSEKLRFRNPVNQTSITDLDGGGTKMSEFIGVVGALRPDRIDQVIAAAETAGDPFPLNLE